MAKNVKKLGTIAASGRFEKRSRTAKTAAASVLTQRSAKTGKFSDGVKAVSRRDRTGLIKLADR
jgi:hypothetical protein